MSAQRRVIRVDGTEEALPKRVTMNEISRLIGASSLDTVNLRHLGYPLWVMVVDDLGHPNGLPVNPKATELYHANCRPGATHTIRGDVVIVADEDFA